MATRVSCAPEAMIISLFMPLTPAAENTDSLATEYTEHAEQPGDHSQTQQDDSV
jgi:hypothetical protein